MFSKKITIQNPTGLHARPASDLTQLAKKFQAEITLVTDTSRINPKSIVAVLSAGLKCGTAITVEVVGENEQEVCEEIVNFIEQLSE